MPESLKTRLARWGFNWFPTYRGTGGRIVYIAHDWHEVRVRLRLSWRTRNYVGTIFGGSMYGAVDPIYMIMLIKILGPDYVVWDKAATIRFKRPGRSTLFARFEVSPEQIAELRYALRESPTADRTFRVELVDADGVVHAEVEKLLHIRRPSQETR